MRVSNGGLKHEQILRLTWRQFEQYLDSFTYLLREESEEGRTKNREADLIALREDPEIQEQRRKDKERAKSATQHLRKVDQSGKRENERDLLK